MSVFHVILYYFIIIIFSILFILEMILYQSIHNYYSVLTKWFEDEYIWLFHSLFIFEYEYISNESSYVQICNDSMNSSNIILYKFEFFDDSWFDHEWFEIE